jgi:hypothetical protein
MMAASGTAFAQLSAGNDGVVAGVFMTVRLG